MDSETLEFLAELEREHDTSTANEALVPAGERPCPICRQKMDQEVQFGVCVDVCQSHGVWLDRSELHTIVSRIRSGERLDRIQALRQVRREGKTSGAVLGLWSLLLD